MIYRSGQITKIRRAAEAAAGIRNLLVRTIQPGITAEQLNELAAEQLDRIGAESALRKTSAFPGNICISINEEAAHGIPKSKTIIDGDLVSVDVAVFLNGFYGDTAQTIIVGKGSEKNQKLISAAEHVFHAAISEIKASALISNITRAMQKEAAIRNCGLVREFVGHGCGQHLHEEPEVPSVLDPKRRDTRLRPGMILAIEPIVCAGNGEIYIDKDGWTVKTKDNKPAVHKEEMILITQGEPEILTWEKTQ